MRTLDYSHSSKVAFEITTRRVEMRKYQILKHFSRCESGRMKNENKNSIPFEGNRNVMLLHYLLKYIYGALESFFPQGLLVF